MSEVGVDLSPEPITPGGDDAKSVVADSAGARLSAARLALGLGVNQVAEQLKLSHRQIVALEANEFDKLPKMVIVRGFVRSYAKLLKIDPASVIACLPPDHTSVSLDTDLRPTLATPFMESRSPFLGRTDTNRKYLIGAGVLAVAAMLFLVAQHFEQSEAFKDLFSRPDQSKSQVAEIAASKAASSVAASADAVFPPDSASASSTVVERTAPVVDEVATASSVESVASSVVDAKPVQSQPQAASIPVVTPPAPASVAVAPAVAASSAAKSSSNQVRLKFRQDSWIQVKKENGEVLTSHLAKAGTEEFFDIKEGLQLRLGNAHGVDGWVRGAALEIVPPKDTNVVNLTVK